MNDCVSNCALNRIKMRKNGLMNFLALWVWILNFSTASIAAPESKTLDFGIYKLSFDVDNGLAVRREVGVDLPFFKVQNTAEFNVGAQSGSDEESEESDEMEKRRKKREISTEVDTNKIYIRKKRNPCNMPTGGGDTTEARKIKKSSGKAKSKMSKKSKLGRRRRRRREAQADDFNNDVDPQNIGSKLGQTIDKMVQKVNDVWKEVVQSTEQAMREIKQAFDGLRSTPNEIPQNGNPQNDEPPKDAEWIN